MKPHKHAELIKAWADGAEIEFRTEKTEGWHPVFKGWSWDNAIVAEYRIKPQPKPDYTDTTSVYRNLNYRYEDERAKNKYDLKFAPDYIGDLKLTFDGETGKLKSAEVL